MSDETLPTPKIELDKLDGYINAVDIDPTNVVAVAHLAAAYEAHEDWAALSDVLQNWVDIAQSDDERILVLLRLAGVYTNKLGDAAAAHECYQRVLGIDPANPVALATQ